jgi:hypothetical protein
MAAQGEVAAGEVTEEPGPADHHHAHGLKLPLCFATVMAASRAVNESGARSERLIVGTRRDSAC